jgi:hypothetical protein
MIEHFLIPHLEERNLENAGFNRTQLPVTLQMLQRLFANKVICNGARHCVCPLTISSSPSS